MVRCPEFYEKWAKDPNWCEKCKSGVSQINSYLSLLDEFETQGIPKKFTMVNLSERAARPLFGEKNQPIRDKAIEEVATLLRAGWHCRVQDVKRILRKARHNGERDPIKLHGNVTCELLCGDFREKGIQIPDESISLILTDPPYGKEYLTLWEPLGALSERVLKHGGFLIAYAGQDNLPQKLIGLSQHLNYYWTDAFLFTEQNVEHYVHVFNWWKPVVIFFKPPVDIEGYGYIGDLIRGAGPEKDLHPWQQSEEQVSRLIDYFCLADGIVLDPMAGSGTTLAAALKLGRSCIGIDVDAKSIELMKRRLGVGTGQS